MISIIVFEIGTVIQNTDISAYYYKATSFFETTCRISREEKNRRCKYRDRPAPALQNRSSPVAAVQDPSVLIPGRDQCYMPRSPTISPTRYICRADQSCATEATKTPPTCPKYFADASKVFRRRTQGYDRYVHKFPRRRSLASPTVGRLRNYAEKTVW